MILDELAAAAAKRTNKIKLKISADEMRERALQINTKVPFAFEIALNKNELAFICEVKKASPSKSIIAESFDYKQIAVDYQNAGADCISVLTEPTRFLGSDSYLEKISQNVNIPLLRKDFTVDEYMIYQAKVLGASAVLLICAILDTETIKRYIAICDKLGLSALVEAHDKSEISSALNAGARIIGVNNRNLKDFTVDINNCISLRKYIPQDVIYVAESGIKNAGDTARIRNAGINAVLVGETLMRANDKKTELNKLKEGSAVEN